MKKYTAVCISLWLLIAPVRAQWHGYIGIENLNLTPSQRSTLVAGLQALGQRNNGPWPHLINHWRVRPDNQAVIFEAEWDDATITVAALRQRLATMFGVELSTITASAQQTSYGPVVTFAYDAPGETPPVDEVRAIMFGGQDSEWSQSRDSADAYLVANRAGWE